MNTDNYYTILGVPEDATQDDIKKAYRKLAKENHPDKGGDEEVFKNISIAYDTIGSDENRKKYDFERKNPFGGMKGHYGEAFQSMYQHMYRNQGSQEQRVPTKTIAIDVTVLDSFLSKEKQIEFSRKIKCEPCDGKGGERHICQTCSGQGQVIQQMGSGMFIQIVSMSCNACSGRGYTLVNKCTSCLGSGTKNESKKVEVKIPHGIDNGQFLRMKGVGDFSEGLYGDLVIKVNLQSENDFDKYDNNLVYNKYFNINDFNEESFEIPHPDGTMRINFPKNIDTSKPLRVKGKGFKHNGVGDLFINQYLKYEKT